MSDNQRGQIAWFRCEQALWGMVQEGNGNLKDAQERFFILLDRIRDMANEMTPEQLERLAEQWERKGER